MMDGCDNVEQLKDDEWGECDGDDPNEWLLE